MLEGQEARYKGQKTFIKTIHSGGKVTIVNPEWDWDMEADCVANDIEYTVPFWITVNASELTKIDPDQIREQQIIHENSHGFGVNVDDFIWMQNRKNG